MSTCKDCRNADKGVQADILEDGYDSKDRVIWCEKKEAWVNVEWPKDKCFEEKICDCKSCGRQAFVKNEMSAGVRSKIYAGCIDDEYCGARGPYRETEEEAIEAWTELNKD